MRFKLHPSDRLKDRIGDVTVSTLLALLLLAAAACGGTSRGDQESEAQRQKTKARIYSTQARAPQPPPEVSKTDPVPETPGAGDTASTESARAEPVSFAEAASAFHEGRLGDAVELFTVYVEHRPKNPWGYYMLGLSLRKAGDHVLAEHAFGQALERDPRHVKSLINLSRVLLATGRPQEALDRIDDALDIEPESNDAYRLEGLALYDLGFEETAIESFWEAIALDDRDAWSMNNLGLILIRQERFDEALLPLARAAELRDDVAVFQNNLAVALERTGYLAAAIDTYRAVLALDSSYHKASISLARVEGLELDPSVGDLDLPALAQRFATDVEEWRESLAAEVVPETELQPEIIERDSSQAGDPEVPTPSEPTEARPQGQH